MIQKKPWYTDSDSPPRFRPHDQTLADLGIDHGRHALLDRCFLADHRISQEWIVFREIRRGIEDVLNPYISNLAMDNCVVLRNEKASSPRWCLRGELAKEKNTFAYLFLG